MSTLSLEGFVTCPKCHQTSGNDWSQCEGSCPMPMSPHYKPKDSTEPGDEVVAPVARSSSSEKCFCGKPDSHGTHGPTICDTSPDTIAWLEAQRECPFGGDHFSPMARAACEVCNPQQKGVLKQDAPVARSSKEQFKTGSCGVHVGEANASVASGRNVVFLSAGTLDVGEATALRDWFNTVLPEAPQPTSKTMNLVMEYLESHNIFQGAIDTLKMFASWVDSGLSHEAPQPASKELVNALRLAASELEQYVDLQQKMDYIEYAADTQKKLDVVNAALTKAPPSETNVAPDSAIEHEFHNIDDVVEIRQLRRIDWAAAQPVAYMDPDNGNVQSAAVWKISINSQSIFSVPLYRRPTQETSVVCLNCKKVFEPQPRQFCSERCIAESIEKKAANLLPAMAGTAQKAAQSHYCIDCKEAHDPRTCGAVKPAQETGAVHSKWDCYIHGPGTFPHSDGCQCSKCKPKNGRLLHNES